MPDISIIINHYQSTKSLKLSLGYVSAWKQDFEKDGNTAEVIVTDSGTLAETKEMMQDRFGSFTFLQEPKNIGFGKCVNRAWRLAQGKYIFTINADLVIGHPWELNKLLDYMRENEDIGMLGPKLLNFDNTNQTSAFRFYTPMTILYRRTPLGRTARGKKALKAFVLSHKKDIKEKPTEVDWLMGSAFLVKKEYLNKVGFFDERFFMYMEDVDLCRRFWEAGYKVVYYPVAEMYHFHGKASRSQNIFFALANKYTRVHLASAYKYFRKHGLKTPRYGV